MQSINPQKSFNSAHKSYNQFAFIQKEVAREVALLASYHKYESVLELGCGSGALYEALLQKPKRFLGVDFSEKLLSLHPKDDSVELLNMDFESDEFFDVIKKREIDLVLSSCSLQWCKNPKRLFEKILKDCKRFCFAVVADTTFCTLHSELGTTPPIQKTKNILDSIPCEFTATQKSYELYFESRLDALKYIKYSGTSGGVGLVNSVLLRRYLKNVCEVKLNFDVVYVVSP